MKKRAFSFFLCLALIMTFLSVPALADDQVTVAVNDHNQTFSSLEEAVTKTYDEWFEGTVTLLDNDTLQDNLNIPEGIKVVIPTSATANDSETGSANVPGSGTTGTAFATLFVPEGKILTIEKGGTLLVAGNQQSTQPLSGFLTGPYGAMVLDGKLIVNGDFYARGEVTTNGTGSITANSGGSVYQRFQIYDWRGGTQSVTAHVNEVFPFSIYDLGGISVDTTYLNGSNLIGQSYLYISDTPLTEDVNYLGYSNGLVRFREETGNGVTFTKDENGVTTITANTDLYTDGLAMTVTVGEIFGRPITHTFSTKTRDCPFGFKLNLTVAKDASLSVESRFKILPGCTFDIEGSLDVTSDGALYFYAAGTYSTNYFFNNAGSLAKMNWDISKAATLEGTGTFTSTGKIGSSVADWTNLPSTFEKTNQTATVREFEQGAYSDTPVTFYLATPPVTPAE